MGMSPTSSQIAAPTARGATTSIHHRNVRTGGAGGPTYDSAGTGLMGSTH